MTRAQDVIDARAAADEWAAGRTLPESGGYSGQWYRDEYLGGWWPEGWRQWWADYSAPPGSLIGGLVVAHQYTSTPIDMDEMLESEIVTQPTGDPCAPVEAQRDGLINTLGYVGGDLLSPVAKLKLTSQPKAVQALVAGIRGVCDQQGISHA